MKTDHRWLKPILCFAMLVLLVSCATYIPTDNSVGNMSVKQARNVLATKLMNNKPYEYKDVRVTSKRLFVTAPEGKQSVFIFRELPQISQGGASELDIWFADRVEFLIFGNPRAFVNALYVLKQNAIRQKKASDEFDASFAASLADYRKMAASNAALPEEANKYKVQAEGAVRDKEFDDAADLSMRRR